VGTSGSITAQIEYQIRSSRFVIADLSDDNSGAYWEGGFAEGLGRPVFYLYCQNSDSKGPHFDKRNDYTMMWEENGDEKESFEEKLKELKAVIRNTFPDEAQMEDAR
jgi:nucleoside 2-deoxyribosyltransferase